MNQRNYSKQVLKWFNIEKCKLVKTPFDVNSKLSKVLDEEFVNAQKKMEMK